MSPEKHRKRRLSQLCVYHQRNSALWYGYARHLRELGYSDSYGLTVDVAVMHSANARQLLDELINGERIS